MGIGCVLLLWTMVASAAAVAGAIGALVLVRGIRSRSTIGMIIGAVLTAGGGVVMVGAIAFVVSWLVFGGRPHYSTSPRAFRAEFGFEPGRDVSRIQSESSGSTDSVVHFLRFRSSPRTIATITNGRFATVAFARCEQELFRLEKKPHWWRPLKSATATCYSSSPFDDSFASNEAWLAYDPASGDAHFYYVGVD